MPRDRGPRTRIARGIYQDAKGYELQPCEGGIRGSKRLPLSTSRAKLEEAMEDLRADLRRRARKRARGAPKKGTLAALAPEYLAAVRAMPSYASRCSQIAHWVATLGDVPLAQLTHLRIAQQLQRWRTDPRDPEDDESAPYSVQYVRHLHTAIRHLFTTLDPDGDNPATKVAREAPPELPPREIPLWDFLRILRHFPIGSKMRARLAIMATTGLGPAEIARLRPGDVQLATGVLVARARRKGGGTEARAVPLTRHARLAVRTFVRLGCFGPFTTSNMRRAFRLAATKAGYRLRDKEQPEGLDWRPYDARHLFGATVGRLSRDERAVQQLLGQTDIRTTRRYTQASVGPRVAAAMAALEPPGGTHGAVNGGRKSMIQSDEKGRKPTNA